MVWVLGIGGYSHDASAALLKDGHLVAAVQEERFTRIKHQGGFPVKSIDFCLSKFKIKPQEISAVAFYTKFSNWDRLLWADTKSMLRHPVHSISNGRGSIATLGVRLYRALNFRADRYRFFEQSGLPRNIFHAFSHHACHAASAYFSSPFDKAIILCIDSVGDGDSTTGWLGEGNKLQRLNMRVRYPHSIAVIYGHMTRHLGFLSTGDEYKMMGLAAYGKPIYLDRLRNLIVFNSESSYRLNMDYFSYQYLYNFSSKFYAEFGSSRQPNEPISQYHADLASSMQKLFEETVARLASQLKKETGIRNLCLAGGAALNCKSNGALMLNGDFDRIFVPSAASDLGTSIGAAQYYWHNVMNNARVSAIRTDDWGPEYDNVTIERELNKFGLDYKVVHNPAHQAARLISEGKIVGWFQGRMEFGPRTLGYRSILADPRNPKIKDRVNETIKFREEFRPFAPSIMSEHVKKYFGFDLDSPFMTVTMNILEGKRAEIPGVVHVDGSGRLQTVSRTDQPLYYNLISKFFEITGTPVVLNTSFNLAGEPIVSSPQDAVRTFYTSGMDVLVIGNYVVHK